MFLAGRLAPLSLFPPAVASVAGLLWFRPMLSFPVEILTGAVSGRDRLLLGFASQVFWLAAWGLACLVAWRRGIRRYGAVGG
jgi:ABC-2 type transport system permease protein